MSDDARYLAVLGRITRSAPMDLDPVLFPDTAAPAPAVAMDTPTHAPSAALWTRPDFGPSYIGIRVKTHIASPDQLAAVVAAAAVERQIIPIFLSWNGTCDMQRFGFRVEYICGTTDADCSVLETEVARLWNLAIIVDADAVGALG
jgi:hypothetical protein